MTTDERWIRECLHLARRGRGSVSPNPLVGAVLVRKGEVIGRGWHRRFGGPHAEVNCLRHVSRDPAGATLYVNLEPCSHTGKTPPCAPLIIRSGIARVVVGMKDPNPAVSGRGIRLLKKSGIEVVTGVLEDECRFLNRHFTYHMTTGFPYIHAKVARTIDGKITARTRWISGLPARQMVHRWRAQLDAVLVGAGTILADDPLLDVRHGRGRDPAVVVLDGALRIPLDSRILRKRSDRIVYVCSGHEAIIANRPKVRGLEATGAHILSFPSEKGRISLRRISRALYQRGIGSVLVEGGADVFEGFYREGLVNELSIFVSPRVSGEGRCMFGDTTLPERNGVRQTVSGVRTDRIGDDQLVTFYYKH